MFAKKNVMICEGCGYKFVKSPYKCKCDLVNKKNYILSIIIITFVFIFLFLYLL